MKNKYKKASSMTEIIDLVKKKIKINIGALSSYKKNSSGIHQIPYGSAYVQVGPTYYAVYCKDRVICKKIYTLLKEEGYYVKWIHIFGGNRVFWVGRNPEENFKKYGVYA